MRLVKFGFVDFYGNFMKYPDQYKFIYVRESYVEED